MLGINNFFSPANLYFLLFSAVFIFKSLGCSQIATSKEHAEYYKGRPVDELINLWESPNSYSFRRGWKKEEHAFILPNGNIKYTNDSDKNCTIIWEVNPSGIIVGYELLGKYCD